MTDQDLHDTVEVASTISRFLNRGGNVEKLVAEMMRDHRTLKQLAFGFCLEYIHQTAMSEYDGRNEASVKLAKKLDSFRDQEHYGTRMPLI